MILIILHEAFGMPTTEINSSSHAMPIYLPANGMDIGKRRRY